MQTYHKGTEVRCKGTFTDAAGAAISPSVVKFKLKDPDGANTTYIYGPDVQLVKDSNGNYHVDVDANKAGEWHYRFESAGGGKAAGETGFEVAPSVF